MNNDTFAFNIKSIWQGVFYNETCLEVIFFNYTANRKPQCPALIKSASTLFPLANVSKHNCIFFSCQDAFLTWRFVSIALLNLTPEKFKKLQNGDTFPSRLPERDRMVAPERVGWQIMKGETRCITLLLLLKLQLLLRRNSGNGHCVKFKTPSSPPPLQFLSLFFLLLSPLYYSLSTSPLLSSPSLYLMFKFIYIRFTVCLSFPSNGSVSFLGTKVTIHPSLSFSPNTGNTFTGTDTLSLVDWT